MLKKILIGSGFAFTLFLITIFLFGDQNVISILSPQLTKEQAVEADIADQTSPKNLTDAISVSMAEQLLKDNPDGPQTADDGSLTAQILDQKKFVTDALTAEVGQFAPEDLIEPVVETNITVLPENSNAGATMYFQSLLKIIGNTLTTSVSATDENQAAMFAQLSKERSDALKALYALKPTPDLADLHRDILTAVGTQRNIFDALAQYETDPMKALMAAKFESDVDANLKDITQRMTEYVTENKLKI